MQTYKYKLQIIQLLVLDTVLVLYMLPIWSFLWVLKLNNLSNVVTFIW